MKLRERFILLLTPLVILPLSFVMLIFIFFLEKIAPLNIGTYRTTAFVFVGVLAIIVVIILLGLANSIVAPLKAVIESAQKIAQGDLDHTVSVERADDETGQLVCAIEEMKSALKQQKKTVEEAAALSAIGRQAAQVAHDIRGPISSIQTSVDFFSNQPAASVEFQKHLHLLSLGTRRLFNIADDLVGKYRGEQDRRRLFSLHHILDNLIREFSSQPKHCGVVFLHTFHPADICLFQERAMIERIFANLMKNALEAIGLQGHAHIKTFLEGDKAVVKMEDDGCGIERDKLALIFDDHYTSGKEGGTGLGLAYVKKTVEGAGGEIAVESKLGVGTVFTIKFPVAKREQIIADAQFIVDAPREVQGPSASAKAARPDKTPVHGYTVLVIDDDETIRLAWELMDRKLQIQKLHTFATLEAMFGAMEAAMGGAKGPGAGAGGKEGGGSGIDLAAVDIAFVDKNILGSRFTGAQVVAYLKARGVPKVILASGENSEALQQDPEFAQADFIVSEKIPQSFKMFFS